VTPGPAGPWAAKRCHGHAPSGCRLAAGRRRGPPPGPPGSVDTSPTAPARARTRAGAEAPEAANDHRDVPTARSWPGSPPAPAHTVTAATAGRGLSWSTSGAGGGGQVTDSESGGRPGPGE